MPAPLPRELRTRIVEAYQRGEGSFEELAARFRVGVATVNRYMRRVRHTGSVDPEPHGGGMTAKIGPEDADVLAQLVRTLPNASAADLAMEWRKRRGVRISLSAMKRALRRLGLTHKKSVQGYGAAPRRSTG